MENFKVYYHFKLIDGADISGTAVCIEALYYTINALRDKIVDAYLSGTVCDSLQYNNKGLFEDCTELKELDVAFLDTDKVTCLCNFCSGCIKLTEFRIASWDISKLRHFDSMFTGTPIENRIKMVLTIRVSEEEKEIEEVKGEEENE